MSNLSFCITKFGMMSNFDKINAFNVKIGHIFFDYHSPTISKKMITERDTPGFSRGDPSSSHFLFPRPYRMPPPLQLPDGVPEEMHVGGVADVYEYFHWVSITRFLYKWISAPECDSKQTIAKHSHPIGNNRWPEGISSFEHSTSNR
jgi:hypothetical protein